MKTLQNLLPPEERTLHIGHTSDGNLFIVAKFIEPADGIDGHAIPFSRFSETITSLADLERYIVDHFQA